MENISFPIALSESNQIDCAGLIDRIRKYEPEANVACVEKAFRISVQAHEKQYRDNGAPYITHPLAVANILAHMKVDIASIVTGLLHDTIEDTEITREFI